MGDGGGAHVGFSGCVVLLLFCTFLMFVYECFEVNLHVQLPGVCVCVCVCVCVRERERERERESSNSNSHSKISFFKKITLCSFRPV